MIDRQPHDALRTIESAIWECGGCRRTKGKKHQPEHREHWTTLSEYFMEHRFSTNCGWSDEEMRVEVLGTWEQIRYPLGWDALNLAFQKATAEPLTLSDDDYDGDDYQLFVSVAGWLQVALGDRPILLPEQKLGDLFRCTRMTISRYRRMAQEAGYLQVVKEHSFSRRKATEFRFRTELWPELHQRTQKSAAGGNQDGAEEPREPCPF